MINIPMDNLHLGFTVEDWLESDTAELTIDIDASVEGSDGFELRNDIKKSLNDLIDTDWRFVRVDRKTDRTGREVWRVSAQARVAESEINNLGGRTKKLGKVGLQYRVGRVDYSPTQEQVEDLNRALRSKVNELVQAELEALNKKELICRQWRVASITYDNTMSYSNARAGAMIGGNQNMVLAASASGAYDNELDVADAETSSELGGFEVSQKVIFNANVVLASTVPGYESN